MAPPPPAETAGPAERAPAVEDPANSNALVKGAKTAETAPSVERAPLDPELQAALSAPPLAHFDVSLSLETRPHDDLKVVPQAPEVLRAAAPSRDGFSFKTSSLFFGSSLGSPESIERWQPGEEPVIVMPGALPDPDMKVMASLPVDADGPVRAGERGESIAPRAKSIPTTSMPRRRPSASACSTRSRAPNRRSAWPKQSISKPAAKRCAARSRWRRWC